MLKLKFAQNFLSNFADPTSLLDVEVSVKIATQERRYFHD
jgi:hypothetical protein